MTSISVSGYPPETDEIRCVLNRTDNDRSYCSRSPEVEYQLFYLAMFFLKTDYVVRNSSDGKVFNLENEEPAGYFKDLMTGSLDVMDPDYIPKSYPLDYVTIIPIPLIWDREVFIFNNAMLIPSSELSFQDIFPSLALVLILLNIVHRVFRIYQLRYRFLSPFFFYFASPIFMFFYKFYYTKVVLRKTLLKWKYPFLTYEKLAVHLSTGTAQLCVDVDFELESVLQSCTEHFCTQLLQILTKFPPFITDTGAELDNCMRKSPRNVGLIWRNDMMPYVHTVKDVTVAKVEDPLQSLPFMTSYVAKNSTVAPDLMRAYLAVFESGFATKVLDDLHRNYHSLVLDRPDLVSFPCLLIGALFMTGYGLSLVVFGYNRHKGGA